MPSASRLPVPRPVVLDTNVVLDWLLFDSLDGRAIGAALADGRLRWIATAPMRDEFAHVLGRGAFERWRPDLAAMIGHWQRWCHEVATPVPGEARWRCTDPDDQKFIDLAAATAGSLLLSRDRAVLKLGRRLRGADVAILEPAAWLATMRGDA